MIKVIPATEANRLLPEQWVNIYELTLTGDAEFYDCCQVKDLVDLENSSEYDLELIDEAKVMPVGEALK
ncbi:MULTISPECIES: hypothetical protein [unclassified Microcoleus]|uniref:hypothetical protein n=1 Tax=unclassified Microcoleus TaxID=2642155 RepID=UPI002FD4F4D9